MRVAHVAAGLGHGGAERVLVDLAVHHARAGVEVAIIAPPGALDREWDTLGIRRIEVPAAGRAPRDVARTVGEVARAVRRVGPDVLHAHNVKATGFALGGVIATTGRARVLTTLHGVAGAEMGRSAQILRFSALTVAVSEAVREEVIAHGLDSARVSVILNGVSPAEPLDDARRSAYLEELSLRGPVVAAVGRLAPEKAYDRFLAAAALVLADRPEVTFLVVGDGALRAPLEQQARDLGIADSVRFAGLRDDARALIALADLLVFSSEREGLSIAALEALAAGTPVLAPDVPGMHELLASGAGAVVPVAEPAALAEQITALVSDPERRAEMGGVGRRLIDERFSARAMHAQYLEAYRRLRG
jgi:glycosyltransferase involved in cell wall biosynthesis